MKQVLYILLISLLIFTLSINVSGQRNKKSNPLTISVGAGIAVGDFSGISAYGPNVMFDVRKTVIKTANSFSFSFDTHVSVFTGFFETKNKTSFAVVPSAATSFNFNAYAGASRKSRSPLGGFIGFGLYAISAPPSSVVSENATVTMSGDIGPYANMGFRIKTKKTCHINFKFFGGFSVFKEIAYGGLNILIPINSNKRRFKRNNDCGC